MKPETLVQRGIRKLANTTKFAGLEVNASYTSEVEHKGERYTVEIKKASK